MSASINLKEKDNKNVKIIEHPKQYVDSPYKSPGAKP